LIDFIVKKPIKTKAIGKNKNQNNNKKSPFQQQHAQTICKTTLYLKEQQ
jgi:hypothetical protein